MSATIRWFVGYTRRRVQRRAVGTLIEVGAWRMFWRAWLRYGQLRASAGSQEPMYLYPCIFDNTPQTAIEPVYFYQDAWAFECITAQRPTRHIDVGSHHKFVALLSKVVPVTMVDIRPLSLRMESIDFQVGSILELPYPSHSLPSVSSICVVEHIGLGRYGDPLDVDGSLRALEELKRVVQPGGDLYLSVPVEPETAVHFNAHRAFSEPHLERLFAPFDIVERRYIVGTDFVESYPARSCVGCYHLRRPFEQVSSCSDTTGA
jgi:SAM-dependent methyltransferase